jgi:hypothetical protein
MSSLRVPFTLHGASGHVEVSVRANVDPSRFGCDLLDPALPRDCASGYPVCRADVTVAADGYAAACGWIQFVRSTDAGDEFDVDPLALLRGVATPFAFFGIEPTLFDAPFRDARRDMTWQARSFLCAVPDCVMSRRVAPLAAFAWGFHISNQAVTIDTPVALALATWDDHVPQLRDTFPEWEFVATAPATS